MSASSGSYSSGHAQQQVQQSIRTLSTGTPPSQPPQQQQQQADIKMSQQSQPIVSTKFEYTLFEFKLFD